MNNLTNKKYPIIRKGKGGYWHAFGNGWAVCAPTKKDVEKKYREMLDLINDLLSRPLPKANDIL